MLSLTCNAVRTKPTHTQTRSDVTGRHETVWSVSSSHKGFHYSGLVQVLMGNTPPGNKYQEKAVLIKIEAFCIIIVSRYILISHLSN